MRLLAPGTRFARFGPYGILLAVASLGEPTVVARAASGVSPAQDPVNANGAVECPPGTLPDVDVCVRLPGEDPGAPETESQTGSHTDRRGRYVVYDQIPRRPDRPADYDLYEYPVPCAHDCVVSGYDLDLPDARQRRGHRLSHVGHGAVDIPQPKGTPITMVALDHQEGDADVVYVGPLFGTTVVTRHALREGGRLRDYVLLFAHLEAPAPGLERGSRLKAGDLVGLVGDTGSPELVHLHLEARRVREGIDALKLTAMALANGDSTVVCDPRNVLPLR
jgi:murein DD-endopeptidase MepM/ murein hydrolase activator NlpD